MYANRSYKFHEILQTHYCIIANVYVFLGQTPYIQLIRKTPLKNVHTFSVKINIAVVVTMLLGEMIKLGITRF